MLALLDLTLAAAQQSFHRNYVKLQMISNLNLDLLNVLPSTQRDSTNFCSKIRKKIIKSSLNKTLFKNNSDFYKGEGLKVGYNIPGVTKCKEIIICSQEGNRNFQINKQNDAKCGQKGVLYLQMASSLANSKQETGSQGRNLYFQFRMGMLNLSFRRPSRAFPGNAGGKHKGEQRLRGGWGRKGSWRWGDGLSRKFCVNFSYFLYYLLIEGPRVLMGCQQSQLSRAGVQEEDIPEKERRGNNRKKFKNQRVNPTSGGEEVQENITRLDLAKSAPELEFIEHAISKHFLLFKLTKQERRELAYAMEAYSTPAGEYVFRQGTTASMFFIIFEGSVQIEINGASSRTLHKGDFFGELAIIYSSPRSASVRATEGCVFWCLSQQIFLGIQREMVKHNYKIAKPYVNKIPIFKYLTSKQRDAISYHMNTLKYEQNDAVFKAGDAATSFYIILEGLIEIDIPGKPALQLAKGESFGENCLKPNKIRSGTAKCLGKTQLLAISREDLKLCLGGQLQEEILFHNIIKWALRRSSVFGSIGVQEQQKFITSGEIVLKRDEQCIARAGENNEYLYICLEGAINNYEIGTIINESQAVEEESTLFISNETLVKKEPGFIFMVALKNIQKERTREKQLQSSSALKDAKVTSGTLKSAASNSNLKMDFKDLYILCKLGEGQMGKVFLVENKKTEKRYALKCVEKNLVVKHQMEKFLKGEKEILQLCDFPLIVKLTESYKDSHFVYLLLKYIEGGDFFDFLSDLGICDNTTARFYFGCFLLILEYLHKNSIVYRDLKPENAAIDANGYLHLIDLGTAKQLTEESEAGLRTFTIIGTPHYMAPEVFEAKGYSFSVDIWSLGVILYEMVCGILPYGSYSDDPVSIYQEIERSTLKFPKTYTDLSGKELISRLLQKHPEKRAVEDFAEIKHMEYFRNFNWKLLEAQKMVAPIRPKIAEAKFTGRSQYLLNYLQKEKLKMDKPIPSNSKWDEVF